MERTLSFLALLVVSLFFVVNVTPVSATENLQYEDSDEYQNSLKEQARNKVTLQVDSSFNEIEEAYEKVQKEEEYIVDLINKYVSDRGATLKSWKENLNWLESNYSELKCQEDVNMRLIDSYVEAYRLVLQDEKLPDEKYVNDTAANVRTYSRTNAVNYAQTYWNNYNPNYPDWTPYGGDCANFVSQCLKAGGKPMTVGPATDFSYWFSSGNTANVNNVSSTWRGADAFRHYWQVNATKYKTFTSFSGAYNYGFKGDAVTWLNSNGRGFHTVIIAGYSNGDLIYSAHTANTFTDSLQAAAAQYSFIIFGMQ